MSLIKNNLKSIVLIIAVVFVFVGSGLYHLNQFETSDEHFWRLERIPQYWTAITTLDPAQTYINDKPGVSVALVSGMSLPFTSLERSSYPDVQEYTMTLNYALRLPILLFNGLVMLPLLFWLMTRAFDRRVASIGIILIGVNPILIGISQIINPDALLWSFSASALFSFFALLKTNEKKFIILTGVLTGFALLSKYTANLLFVFYIMIAGLWIIYTDISNIKKWLRTFLLNYLFIFLISVSIFALFLPATILDLSLFLYGTILSPPIKPIIIPLFISIILLTIDAYFIKAQVTASITNLLKKIKLPILYISVLPLLLIILFSLLNAWTDTQFITLDNLKEVVADKQELRFPMLEGLPAPIYFAGEIAIQSFNILFSLTPIVLIFTLTTLLLVFFKKIPTKYYVLLIFCAITPLLFFVGGLLSETFVNIRYAIILQPLFALIASIGLSIIIPQRKYFFTFSLIFIFFIQSLSVYYAAPYYFNYQNIFLPQKFILTDSWSYGIFEATQYLNSLPNAQDLTIWSDRKAACYYFDGKCIMRRKLDGKNQLPDYFIVTRRGVLRHHFKWQDAEIAPFPVETIYTESVLNNPHWRYDILNRPQNYIKIIKTQDILNK
ncbi:MAG: ArnT family glycosyltransferase [Candidatus Moraniibacteriota bacterium]|jgi:4-amino-4-deoxy-L-arabinose transferase-like glycosyltransferase